MNLRAIVFPHFKSPIRSKGQYIDEALALILSLGTNPQ